MVTTTTLAAASAACVATGVAIGWTLAQTHKREVQEYLGDEKTKDKVIASLQEEVERQKKLRAQERSGRTNAEKEAREAIQRQQELTGYKYEAIGQVQSCFVERRGTPRQSTLVPSSRGRIKLRTNIPPSSLECLDQFSHLWVIFDFHENTNVSKKTSTFPAKIAPPRLGGQKVGLFSTRTPHRPNSIGLTVVKIDAVYGRYIEISGHDLVNGTPVLDVKPYVPMDFIPDHVCPHWVNTRSDHLAQPVEFASEVTETLTTLVKQEKLRFYKTVEDVSTAIQEMLVLDIRSVHQGRGKAAEEQIFMCRFDNLEIDFQTLEDKIHIVKCTYCPST
ncbi:hypothetical protein Poli38472_004036 [Pythium oligandrum]|uniref:TsaA-like domain-containing protein n=1 Tax=Pythium oligandrum TaxID=41045 RepID=A0A8K1FKP3_PYTOL|nr:hypothetical protein Poli38472_004036 [Pythium oligandrum]|eukprot:TMW66271.1 hypothetical protein Poli38472_004036 [Pythium oligandrum]